MCRLLLIAVLAAAAVPAAAAAPKRVHGARLAPTFSTPPTPSAKPVPMLTSLGPRLMLTGLPSIADRRATCRDACARQRFRTDAADEDGATGWGRCTAACDVSSAR